MVTERSVQLRSNARRTAVISSPLSGVSPVTAAGVLWALAAAWTHYLNTVSAADLVLIPLSLLFFEFSGDCVNAVHRHVTAADALVRRGVDRNDFR